MYLHRAIFQLILSKNKSKCKNNLTHMNRNNTTCRIAHSNANVCPGLAEGDIGVCSDVVLHDFWCGFAEILIVTCSIAVL